MGNHVKAQRGFALILALLALMLLTFLGLTLATTTSTELQIATNYRWSQQAYYNAEAGIEAAKLILRDIGGTGGDWSGVLPPRRADWASGTAAPKCGTGGNCLPVVAATRNWEAVDCDDRHGTGFGAVLPGGPTGAYENVTSFQGQPINGAFTLWIRRDIIPANFNTPAGAATDLSDESSNTSLVLVSEGVAPQPATVGGAFLQAARAVRTLQVKLTRQAITAGCQAAEGQTGTTASGANFGACAPLMTGSVDAALGGGGAVTENQAVK